MGNFSKITDAAKDFACGLYRLQPSALISTPASEVLTFIWDGFCGDPPRDPANLPPPPASPFEGGQCVCVAYQVTLDYVNNRTGDSGTIGGSVRGPILEIGVHQSPGGTSGVGAFGRGVGHLNCQENHRWTDFLGFGSDQTSNITVSNIRVERNDGLIDNCGSPPAEYPEVNPPPGGYNSPPTPITINNGDIINVEFNFSPPTAPTPGGKLPPIVINYLKPELNLKIPIEFNFNGDINFGNVQGGDLNFNQDDRDNINNIKNITNNTNNTTNNTNNNVDNFYGDYKKDRDRRINKEPLPDDFDPPLPPKPPGSELVERLAYVNVDLSTIPKNAKSQTGDGAPDVFYAGWFEFMREEKSFPRNYIHFENNCFFAPVGADGYAFTLYNGYQGTAVAITFKE
jgi:hypothetical protein